MPENEVKSSPDNSWQSRRLWAGIKWETPKSVAASLRRTTIGGQVQTRSLPTMNRKSGLETFLRWAGSKRKILPLLATYWKPGFTRYIEPFAGSCALFFYLCPRKAILNDLNDELMRTYRTVRAFPAGVYRELTAVRRGKHGYYKARSCAPESLSRVDRAVRFVYLNRFCFNGLYRTNRAGRFNVPYSGTGIIPPLETFAACARLLSRARLTSSDFADVLEETREGDFVYLDPPYVVESRRVFVEYGPAVFTSKDLNRLMEVLHAMDRNHVRFLLTYADCADIRRFNVSWNVRRIQVHRHISGFAAARRSAYELLISNG